MLCKKIWDLRFYHNYIPLSHIKKVIDKDKEIEINIKGGGGCGRFWNMPILEIWSLHKRLSRISFCMVTNKCMLLIIPKRNFYFIFKIAAKSLKTAKFPKRNHSNGFLNSNCFKIYFKIFIKWHQVIGVFGRYGYFWRYGDFLLPFKGSLRYLFILRTRKRNYNETDL